MSAQSAFTVKGVYSKRVCLMDRLFTEGFEVVFEAFSGGIFVGTAFGYEHQFFKVRLEDIGYVRSSYEEMMEAEWLRTNTYKFVYYDCVTGDVFATRGLVEDSTRMMKFVDVETGENIHVEEIKKEDGVYVLYKNTINAYKISYGNAKHLVTRALLKDPNHVRTHSEKKMLDIWWTCNRGSAGRTTVYRRLSDGTYFIAPAPIL
jgi:hypothetical protein